MTEDAITIVYTMFSGAYSFLTSFIIPGTAITPLGMILFGTLTVYGIHFLKKTLHYD